MNGMIRHKRGDAMSWDLIWWADNAKTTRLDVTGISISATARHETGKRRELPVKPADPANGVVAIEIDKETSLEMEPGDWAVRVTRGSRRGLVHSEFTLRLEEGG